jgi:hypothetical protein
MRELVREALLLLPLLILAAMYLPPAHAEIDPNLLKYNYNATGSVNRPVFDKAMETVSVADFNAAGDGVSWGRCPQTHGIYRCSPQIRKLTRKAGPPLRAIRLHPLILVSSDRQNDHRQNKPLTQE